MKHHPLLHRPQKIENEAVNTHRNSEKDILFQIIPVTLYNGNNKFKTYAFIDHGSSTSLVKREVQKFLKIEGKSRPLVMTWTNGGIQEEPESEEITLQIRGTNGKEFTLFQLRTVDDLSLPSQSLDAISLKKRYKHLKDIEIESYNNASPTILLGLSHSYLTSGKPRRGRFNEPIAEETSLGWMIYGAKNGKEPDRHHVLNIVSTDPEKEEKGAEDKTLQQIMRDYFSTEQFGVQVPAKPWISDNERRAKEIINIIQTGSILSFFSPGRVGK